MTDKGDGHAEARVAARSYGPKLDSLYAEDRVIAA
jgi:hypothetical protein